MNTSSNLHRLATAVAVAVAATIGALSVNAGGAHAIPDRPDSRVVVNRSASAPQRYIERPCFITPATWNEALDGPLPTCRTSLP